MAAGNTYVALATNTLSSAAASVTFSSISGAYTDLVLVVVGGNVSGGGNCRIEINGDTGSNYSSTRILGTGSAASSAREASATSIQTGDVTGTDRLANIVNLMNYANTTTYKTVLSRSNSNSYVSAYVGLWRSTAAIASIIYSVGGGGSFVSGTTFTLYGIAAA